jgi:hypothetical protein
MCCEMRGYGNVDQALLHRTVKFVEQLRGIYRAAMEQIQKTSASPSASYILPKEGAA